MKKMLLKSIVVLLSVLIIQGCESSADNESNISDTQTPTPETPKVLVKGKIATDFTIEGLAYKCIPTEKSIDVIHYTGKLGEFECELDNQAAFYIGDIYLGSFRPPNEEYTFITPHSFLREYENNHKSIIKIVQLINSVSTHKTYSELDNSGNTIYYDYNSITRDSHELLKDTSINITQSTYIQELESYLGVLVNTSEAITAINKFLPGLIATRYVMDENGNISTEFYQ